MMDGLEGQLCPLSLWQVAPHSISFSAVHYSSMTLTTPDEGWGYVSAAAWGLCAHQSHVPWPHDTMAPISRTENVEVCKARHSHAWGNLTAGCIRGISLHEPQLSYPTDSPEDTLSMASSSASVMLPPHCVDTDSGAPHSVRSSSEQGWPNLVFKIYVVKKDLFKILLYSEQKLLLTCQ